MISHDRCSLIRNLFDCVQSVLESWLFSSYSCIDKINLIGLIEMHVKFITQYLEVLKHEKNESKPEKK